MLGNLVRLAGGVNSTKLNWRSYRGPVNHRAGPGAAADFLCARPADPCGQSRWTHGSAGQFVVSPAQLAVRIPRHDAPVVACARRPCWEFLGAERAQAVQRLYSQFFTRLLAFIATGERPPGMRTPSLTVLKRNHRCDRESQTRHGAAAADPHRGTGCCSGCIRSVDLEHRCLRVGRARNLA